MDKPEQDRQAMHNCIICHADLKDRFIKAECGHYFCAECLLCASWASFPDAYRCPAPGCNKAVQKIKGRTSTVVRGESRKREFKCTWANGVEAFKWRLPHECRQWVERTWIERKHTISLAFLCQLPSDREHRVLPITLQQEHPSQTETARKGLIALFAALHWMIVPASEPRTKISERKPMTTGIRAFYDFAKADAAGPGVLGGCMQALLSGTSRVEVTDADRSHPSPPPPIEAPRPLRAAADITAVSQRKNPY